jgi:Leucine-rich repeat (LRR) protein
LKITVLDLSHNQISWIEKRAFINLTSIEILDLSNNRLKSEILTPEIFEGHYSAETYLSLKTLKELRLGNNDLHVLHPDLFEHLPTLGNNNNSIVLFSMGCLHEKSILLFH